MTIQLHLPDHMETKLRAEWPELERHILEGFAVEGFRQGRLSSDEVGQLLGFSNRWETIRFLSDQRVYPGYEVEDFEADMMTLSH